MAAILRSRSIIRAFNGFKNHFLAPGCEVSRVQRLLAPVSSINFINVNRSTQVAAAAVQKETSIDKVFRSINSHVRRTGRVSRREVNLLISHLNSTENFTAAHSLLLLRCLGNLLSEESPQERTKLVQDTWDLFREFNIQVDISHYNTLLRIHLENNNEFLPEEFLFSLEKANIKPDRVTYQLLITRYCQKGDLEGATKILEYMKEQALPVNEGIFNALIIGHARANDMESAEEVLKMMQSSGLAPSTETYKNLMVSYAEKGDIENISRIIEECKSNVTLFNREYMEVIYVLATSGHGQHVSTFLEKFEPARGYRQDAVTLMLRLLVSGYDEIAYTILKTLSTSRFTFEIIKPCGIFLWHLMRLDLYSMVTVVQYCQKMKTEGLHPSPSEKVLNIALSYKPEKAVQLMRMFSEDGVPIRTHYFWPLIKHYGAVKDKENIYKTIQDMHSMNINVSYETYKIYIWPTLLEMFEDEKMAICTLIELGGSYTIIVRSCVECHLNKGNIKSAASVCTLYPVRYHPLNMQNLHTAYVKTKDVTSAGMLLRMAISFKEEKKENTSAENAEESEEDNSAEKAEESEEDNSAEKAEESEEDNSAEKAESDEDLEDLELDTTQDIPGIFLMRLMNAVKRRNLSFEDIVLPMLKEMKHKGIIISKESANGVLSKLGEHLTEEATQLVNEISSENCAPIPSQRKNNMPYQSLSTEELETLDKRSAKEKQNISLMILLLSRYAQEGKVQKADELKQKLKDLGIILSPGTYVRLLNMNARNSQLKNLCDTYGEMKSAYPNVKINAKSVLNMCCLLLSNLKIEETLKILEENVPEHFDVKLEETSYRKADYLLHVAVTKANMTPDLIERLFNLLKKNYVGSVIPLLKHKVRYFLGNNDIDGAMIAFKKNAVEYHRTPMKQSLTNACIKLEDTEKLQMIMDICIPLQGEANCLYDLVFAFLQCGKLIQAKKIINTPGMRALDDKLQSYCGKLLDEERITELEQLVAITKDIFDINRNMMYMFLLNGYKMQDNCDKALSVWTAMQEENVDPDDQFLCTLGQLLMNHGREVPFVMPSSHDTKALRI